VGINGQQWGRECSLGNGQLPQQAVLPDPFLIAETTERGEENSMKHAITVSLSKTRNECGEYVCRMYVNGKRHENGDYFTDDWEDAVETKKAMAS